MTFPQTFPNHPPGAGSIPAPPTKTKMKTNDRSLYNSLACLVILGKELKRTLEDLALALQKSEQILIAHNLKSTRSKK
jgi:hypothetical protein